MPPPRKPPGIDEAAGSFGTLTTATPAPRDTGHRARKAPVDLAEAFPGNIGLAALEHRQRGTVHGGPAPLLANAGATAEQARGGGPADLVVLAVEAGQGRALVNALKQLGARG